MGTSRRPAPFNDQTWEQASDWLMRFSEADVDSAAREQFNEWLRRSPEHVHAYLQVSAFWQVADHVGRKDDGSRDIDLLVARARTAGNVLPLAQLDFERGPQLASEAAGPRPDSELARPKPETVPRRLALAASLLIAMAGLGAYVYLQRGIYRTDIGEQRTVNLPDGSTMTLNADSRVTVRYTDMARTIDLDAGQALFKVAKDAAKPFVVRSGSTNVRAVGTQFDVYRKSTGTVVTVVEGRVAVSSSVLEASDPESVSDISRTRAQAGNADVLLSAGEQVIVAAAIASRVSRGIELPAPIAPVIQPVKVETATAWTTGLLAFDAAPLDEVVREFNRQNAKPLVLEGAGLEAVRITGTFPANGSKRITRFLEERHGVIVHETDDEIRISRR